MHVELGPPDPALAPMLAKYRRRGANDGCLPFRSGNLEAWSCHTRGPITRQTASRALFGALRALPEPFRAHLEPSSLASLGALEGCVVGITREELADRLVGHMALHRGGVCRVAERDEASADVATLLDPLGRRSHFMASSQLFRVGACWSYAYVGLATGRFVLALFLQID